MDSKLKHVVEDSESLLTADPSRKKEKRSEKKERRKRKSLADSESKDSEPQTSVALDHSNSELVTKNDENTNTPTATPTANATVAGTKQQPETGKSKKHKKNKHIDKNTNNSTSTPKSAEKAAQYTINSVSTKSSTTPTTNTTAVGKDSGHKLGKFTNDDSTSGFEKLTCQICITLAPVLCMTPDVGVFEVLNSMLLKYIPQLDGVALCYSKVEYLNKTGGMILYDYPHSNFDVQAEFIVWKPFKGLVLRGMINAQSPSHIGLLVFNTFNASIPENSIPKDKYEWVEFSEPNIYTEYESATPGTQADPSAETAEKSGAKAHQVICSGEWVNKSTGQRVGSEGYVDFVVSDVFRINNVLGVTGSL